MYCKQRNTKIMNYVKSKIVMLPTEDKATINSIAIAGIKNELIILENQNSVFNCNRDDFNWELQHLYDTTDEKISKGDLYYSPEYGILEACVDTPNVDYKKEGCRKIVSSTDKSLGLPTIDVDFLRTYCKAYNEGNPIIEVNIEIVHPNNPIKVNKITPETCEVFTPEGISLGYVNQYEFNDLCIQIKNAKAEGYYVFENGEKVFISSDGKVNMYDTFNLLNEQMETIFFK